MYVHSVNKFNNCKSRRT